MSSCSSSRSRQLTTLSGSLLLTSLGHVLALLGCLEAAGGARGTQMVHNSTVVLRLHDAVQGRICKLADDWVQAGSSGAVHKAVLEVADNGLCSLHGLAVGC